MAGKSRAVQPEAVLRDVFVTGLHEIKRAGIEVRAGNTGTALVVVIEAWRMCPVCGQVVPAANMADTTMCQECAYTIKCAGASTGTSGVPVLAQEAAA